jgi:hypothetical protein
MRNRMLFPQLFAVAGLSLCTNLACCGQSSATAATKKASPPPVQLTPAAEDKEKAEDAALLQQLESDAQQNKSEHRIKGQLPPNALPRGGGGMAVGGGGGMFNGQNFMVHGQDFVTRARPAASALVIQTSESDPKTQTALEEDLAVMSHVLNKALEDLPGGPRHAGKVMGIDVFFSPGGAPLRSLYLDNYGAVFFLNVNFPLIPPAEKRAEEKPTGDSVWEEAWEELYGQRAGGGGGEPAEEYSQEKVDKLKDTLFDTLKNASNIRGLKPNEGVTLWVCGGTSNGGKFRVVKGNQPAAKGANVVTADQVFPGSRRTILTIRARKSDIDEYAKGKLGAEEFQKRAQLTAYTGGGGGGSPESLLMGYTPRNGF